MDKKEIVQECFQMISESLRKLADAKERLEEFDIKLCTYQYPEYQKGFRMQVYRGIEAFADCLDEECDYPWSCGEPEHDKLHFTKDGIEFFELGRAEGYTFL